jgi:hypothetical protein
MEPQSLSSQEMPGCKACLSCPDHDDVQKHGGGRLIAELIHRPISDAM